MFPWRAPLAADWQQRLEALDASVKAGEAVDYAALKSLANQQLGPREQLKLEQFAKRLRARGDAAPGFSRLNIGLLGSRTLTYLTGPLGAAGLARGLLPTVFDAPYDSVASFAFSPAGVFDEKLDALLVVLDEHAFPRPGALLDGAAEDEAVEGAARMLSAIAAAARSKTGATPIIATLPDAPRISASDLATAGADARFRARVNLEIAEGGRRGEWVVWDMAALAARVGQAQWFDPVRYHTAKTPFRIELCPLVADHLCGLLAAMRGKSGRALVLDLDNTLWGGVIGDDGLDGIRLGQNSAEGEAYIAFQKFALALRDRGVVLAVCSKNTDEIAREPFRTHPDMLLREEHIAVFQANWNDKATNIASIARTLDLGLESLVFVDDNPAERERVRQELPLVAVPEVGDDPSFFIQLICESGLFEHLPLNTDDLGRAASYGDRAKRAEVLAQIGNYDDYLRSLAMKMTIAPFDEVGRARIVQLINKSNQFNLTTRRYNDEDIRRMEGDDGKLAWQVRLDDGFGSHGMIGVVIVDKAGDSWRIDSWLQSCRVLERGVEATVMNTLLAQAAAAGVTTVVGEYVPTDRNGMVAGFYERLGFSERERRADGGVIYACDVSAWTPHTVFIDVELSA
jgi:FkbH-like protein